MKKNKKVILTPKGLEKLKEELEMRKNKKRPELTDTIEELREEGDLSENEGYHLALDDRDSNEVRIAELERMIDNAEVIDSCDIQGVCVGSKIKVKVNGEEKTLHLVGEAEADPTEDRISHKSPIGKALLKKAEGDTVTIDIPRGKVKYKILKIENND